MMDQRVDLAAAILEALEVGANPYALARQWHLTVAEIQDVCGQAEGGHPLDSQGTHLFWCPRCGYRAGEEEA